VGVSKLFRKFLVNRHVWRSKIVCTLNPDNIANQSYPREQLTALIPAEMFSHSNRVINFIQSQGELSNFNRLRRLLKL
jgi:hypothetical protein